MKGSLIIVAFFVAGVILARWGVLPQELLQQDFSMYVLYGLMFLVGISIGSDRKAWAALKGQQLRIVLVPLATIVGTLAGSIGVSFLLTDIRLTDCLAIGSGFGYYSLSSIFITEYRGAELGTIALTTNIIREIITWELLFWSVASENWLRSVPVVLLRWILPCRLLPDFQVKSM